MTSITDFLLDAANAEPGAGSLYGLAHVGDGLLVRMMRAETPTPTDLHYNANAPGIAGLLGQVDERLIEDAMAERASGRHTLH